MSSQILSYKMRQVKYFINWKSDFNTLSKAWDMQRSLLLEASGYAENKTCLCFQTSYNSCWPIHSLLATFAKLQAQEQESLGRKDHLFNLLIFLPQQCHMITSSYRSSYFAL